VRERLLFIVAVLAFIAAAPVVYYLLFEYSLSAPTSTDSAPRAPGGLKLEKGEDSVPIPVALSLTQLEGKVEFLRRGQSWQPAEEGMLIEPEDRVRTDQGSKAVLSMPGTFSVELDVQSDFQVKTLTENLSRFLLEDGMIAADVVENSQTTFEVASSTSLARTTGASFRMGVNQEGLVAVGASRGAVDLSAEGKVVRVREGFMARAARGKAPEDPIRVPKALLLKVIWPGKKELASRTLALNGRTERGARVLVDGEPAKVDASGHFSTVATLQEGRNRLQITSYDVGGNRASLESPVFVVDTRAEAFQIQTSPGMWHRPDAGTVKSP
jgi:hypothetical protein